MKVCVADTGVVQESESLFSHLYRASMNYNWFKRTDFVPYYIPTFPPNSSINEGDVTQVCAGLEACRYDYMVAQSRDIASDTKSIVGWDAETRLYGRKGQNVVCLKCCKTMS